MASPAWNSLGAAWSQSRNLLGLMSSSDNSYASVRYGSIGQLLSLFGLVGVEAVRKTHWNINRWRDDEVLAWKNSYVSSCSAIAVAGAIFASVGLQALQLPDMNQTHWIARALLSCSMALGILSVIYATSQQQTVAMLNNPLEIRLWLSRGRVDRTKHSYDMPYRLLPLESSAATVQQFGLPNALLSYAVLLYLVGFGVYLLFAWLYNVESESSGYRNIFICFVATMGIVCIYQVFLGVFSYLDEEKRTKDFNLDRSEDFAKPFSQQQLEVWLKALQDLQQRNTQDEGHNQEVESKVADVLREWMAQTQAELEENELARDKEKRARKMKTSPSSKTLDILASVDATSIHGKKDVALLVRTGPKEFVMMSKTYVQDLAPPNFFFHLTTVYTILRSAGVPVGKMDYLGYIPRKKVRASI